MVSSLPPSAHTPHSAISKSCCFFLRNRSRLCHLSPSHWHHSLSHSPLPPQLWPELPNRPPCPSVLLPGLLTLELKGSFRKSCHSTPLLCPIPSNGSSLSLGGIQSSFHPPRDSYELDPSLLLWLQLLSVSSSSCLLQPQWVICLLHRCASSVPTSRPHGFPW